MQLNAGGWTLGAVGLAVGLLVGYVAAPEREAPLNPAQRELNANLYVQTAAEYHALCLQTFRQASECLAKRLADPPPGDLPFAVIMDLDETVFDNSPYQSWSYRNARTFDEKTWAVWEQKYAAEVGLVPGAREFIHDVERRERPAVKVFYLSNRRDKAGALAALRRLDLDRKNDAEQRLLIRTAESDKEARRRQIAAGHRVLLVIGDNLADLSSDFFPTLKDRDDFSQQTDAVKARLARVKEHEKRFGYDWILLPNPVYGDWTLPLGADPARHLRQTKFSPEDATGK